MVASYAMGCFGGSAGVDIPLGYDCVNTECVQARRDERDERDRAAIARAVERGVINE